LGRLFNLSYKEVTVLLACGSAGAISAIFNTPVAGIVFAIEVLLIDLNRFSLIPLLVASVSATIVTHLLYKEGIMFDTINFDIFKSSYIPYYLVFALIVALASIYFTNVFLRVEGIFEKMKQPIHRILVGGLLLGILLYVFPGLYGEGYLGLKQILNGNAEQLYSLSPFNIYLSRHAWIALAFILLLVFLKVVVTALTIGAGGIGGVFAPAVFTGGMLGFVFASSVNLIAGEPVVSEINFVLVGMAGCLTGVLHAPLTGIFLIAEITQSYSLIVPLMIVATLTYIIVKAFMPYSIFTKQLAEHGELITHHKDKAVIAFMNIEKVLETNILTVSIDANLRGLVQVIAKSNRNIFPVVDENQQLKGIVYLERIRNVIFENDQYDALYVRDLMSNPPAVIQLSDTMQKVIETFNETDAWNLPVVDNGCYVGFISKSKLFGEYRKQLIDITED
jgi:CIC family chloride channel protein